MGLNPEIFIDRYYDRYVHFDTYFEPICEKYGDIQDIASDLKAQRNLKIASRGRWVGGGFGFKGAIKGALSAGLMNAGADAFHFFGDVARESRDESRIEAMEKELRNNDETKNRIIVGLKQCVWGCFHGVLDELKLEPYY